MSLKKRRFKLRVQRDGKNVDLMTAHPMAIALSTFAKAAKEMTSKKKDFEMELDVAPTPLNYKG